jgi:hypothetical protein
MQNPNALDLVGWASACLILILITSKLKTRQADARPTRASSLAVVYDPPEPTPTCSNTSSSKQG